MHEYPDYPINICLLCDKEMIFNFQNYWYCNNDHFSAKIINSSNIDPSFGDKNYTLYTILLEKYCIDSAITWGRVPIEEMRISLYEKSKNEENRKFLFAIKRLHPKELKTLTVKRIENWLLIK
jgi:hypothetical protein